MRNVRRKRGFTLPELLIVVGILAILMAVAFIGVTNYLRSMEKLEYDNYAKEIFVAAQNHLTMAESQGYLGQASKAGFFGKEESSDSTLSGINANDKKDVYYFVTTAENVLDNPDNLLNQMLPFGSVDETVRNGNSKFIIRYHRPTAQVLDVFYWTSAGSRFSHAYVETDYANFLTNKGNKSYLRTYSSDKSVIGYYGGNSAKGLEHGETLKAPEITVINAEKLYVEVKDTNSDAVHGDEGYVLKLIVTGETSGAKKELVLFENKNINATNVNSNAFATSTTANNYSITLDDISVPSKHFYDFCKNGVTEGPGGSFKPGENVIIQAVAYNKSKLTNIAYSASQTTNSLFGEGTSVASASASTSTAQISNVRHLENLSTAISGVAWNDLKYENAQQAVDISWTDYQSKIKVLNTNDYSNEKLVCVHDTSNKKYQNGSGYFYPIDINPTAENRTFKYDGQGHSISDVVVLVGTSDDTRANIGLFGQLNGTSRDNCKISNLRLVNFSVNSAKENVNAGALAGSVNIATIKNVITYNEYGAGKKDKSLSTADVSGTGNVGGLIGSVISSTVEDCGAALIVKSSDGNAGGLIGNIGGGSVSDIYFCYAGGVTKDDGTYSSAENEYNVTGNDAVGGLVGSASTANIKYSYSTSSVRLTADSGGFAGGLIGNSETTTERAIYCCYSTGLVSSKSPTGSTGAFAGSVSVAPDTCYYLKIINERYDDTEAKFEYLVPIDGTNGETFSGLVKAIDADATIYDHFVGGKSGWSDASPYADKLKVYYQGKYNLKSVSQLRMLNMGNSEHSITPGAFVLTHYGDWPAPETWVFNEKS